MKLLKNSLILFLPVFFVLGFIPELSARSHHRHHHHKSTRSSFSFNLNLDARPSYSAGYAVVQQPTYVVQQPTTYIVQSPAYYEQVTVVRPYVAPVTPIIVQRPAPSVYLSPSFSFWSY